MNAATFTFTRSRLDIRNQSTAAPVNYISTGFDAGWTITLIHPEKFEYLKLALQGRIITNPLDPTDQRMDLDDDAGCEMPKLPLLMKPARCGGPSSDTKGWIYMPFACLANDQDFSISYGLEDQRMYTVSIKALPDPDGVLKKVSFGNHLLQV